MTRAISSGGLFLSRRTHPKQFRRIARNDTKRHHGLGHDAARTDHGAVPREIPGGLQFAPIEDVLADLNRCRPVAGVEYPAVPGRNDVIAGEDLCAIANQGPVADLDTPCGCDQHLKGDIDLIANDEIAPGAVEVPV